MISEDEWKKIEETLFLSNIPVFIDSVNKIRKEENWVVADEYNSDEEW